MNMEIIPLLVGTLAAKEKNAACAIKTYLCKLYKCPAREMWHRQTV